MLLLLLPVWSPLEKGVSTRVGGENIFESCFIASFNTDPCCKYGAAGCGCCSISTRSSVARASRSVDDVVVLACRPYLGRILTYLLLEHLEFLEYNCCNSGSVSLPDLCSILQYHGRPMLLFPLLFHVPLLCILVALVVFY
jgi:hypothetical protein